LFARIFHQHTDPAIGLPDVFVLRLVFSYGTERTRKKLLMVGSGVLVKLVIIPHGRCANRQAAKILLKGQFVWNSSEQGCGSVLANRLENLVSEKSLYGMAR
jgi:hypothetical protein